MRLLTADVVMASRHDRALLGFKSVSMGLTVTRQTAKNLTVNLQPKENFTVNRQKS